MTAMVRHVFDRILRWVRLRLTLGDVGPGVQVLKPPTSHTPLNQPVSLPSGGIEFISKGSISAIRIQQKAVHAQAHTYMRERDAEIWRVLEQRLRELCCDVTQATSTGQPHSYCKQITKE